MNFHGATLPRGWSRTYPNLLTVEAVKGFEFATFTQEDQDKVVRHARYAVFQMAEVAVPGELFEKTLRLIDGLAPVHE